MMTHNTAVFTTPLSPKHAKRLPHSGYVQVELWETMAAMLPGNRLASIDSMAAHAHGPGWGDPQLLVIRRFIDS
jgi:hypothetical protein